MSRARQSSHAYLVADDLDQAAEDLRRDWGRQLRPTWAIDTGLPSQDSLTTETLAGLAEADRVHLGALVRARHQMTWDALMGAPPPDPRPALAQAKADLAEVQRARADLKDGRGAYQHTEVGQAARELTQATLGVATPRPGSLGPRACGLGTRWPRRSPPRPRRSPGPGALGGPRRPGGPPSGGRDRPAPVRH